MQLITHSINDLNFFKLKNCSDFLQNIWFCYNNEKNCEKIAMIQIIIHKRIAIPFQSRILFDKLRISIFYFR